MTVTHCPGATGRLRALTAMFALLGVCLVPSLCCAECLPVTERVSVSSTGEQVNGDSGTTSISADGRFVAFASWASDLVPGPPPLAMGIFVRDRLTGVTERVSVTSAGEQANAQSYAPSISADGRFVVFLSDATNLAPPPTACPYGCPYNGVFIHDRLTGTTERVEFDWINWYQLVDHFGNAQPCISVDGRFVATEAETCISFGPHPGWAWDCDPRVLLYDRVTQTMERVCLSPTGVERSASSPSISADGRFVAFASTFVDPWKERTNDRVDVFVRDMLLAVPERVSVNTAGEQANADSFRPAISADGRFVAFDSDASNLVPGDTNNSRDVFVRDRLLGLTERVSISSAGEQGNQASAASSISGDGKFVAFSSLASNLVPYDTNAGVDVFVHDRLTGSTERVSVSSTGEQSNGGSWSWYPSLSADGRFVAFASDASNLVPGDTNDRADVFVRDRFRDTTPPETQIAAGPCGQTLCTPGSTIAWTGQDDHTPVEQLVYSWRIDAGAWQGPTHDTSVTLTTLAEGQHLFEVKARDLCGNEEATPARCEFTIDCTAPETEIISGPCGQLVCSSSATVSWRGTDNLPGPLAYSRRLDSGQWSSWTTDTSTTLTGLSQGQHVIEVKARDLAGNEDPTPARCEFTVVLSPPTVSITSPANGATVRGTVTITATVSPTSASPLRGGGLRWGGTRPAPFVTPALPLPHLRGREAAGTAALQADGIERIEFYANGQLLCTNTTAPYSCAWNTTGCRGARPCAPTNGPAQICAKAFDRCGRSAQHCITVNVRNQTFGDVPPGDPASDAIGAIAARGITSGCMPAQGSAGLPFFCPYASATKAQVAVFICKAAGKTWLDRPTPTFADVPKDSPYYGWIERLCDPASWGGTAPGTPCAIFGGKKFCPTASVSRQEIAWILCRATGKAALDRPTPTFADVPNTNPYHGWIERLADAGSWPGGIPVTNGCACPATYPQPAKCYCPKSPVTRAQLAVFLVRAFGIPL